MRGPYVGVVGLCSESLSHGHHDGQTKGVYDGPLQVPCTKASSMIALTSLRGPEHLSSPSQRAKGTMVLGLTVVRVRAAAASGCRSQLPFQFH
jgi:hypothetical protein